MHGRGEHLRMTLVTGIAAAAVAEPAAVGFYSESNQHGGLKVITHACALFFVRTPLTHLNMHVCTNTYKASIDHAVQ